jgi:hypothetical protein
MGSPAEDPGVPGIDPSFNGEMIVHIFEYYSFRVKTTTHHVVNENSKYPF